MKCIKYKCKFYFCYLNNNDYIEEICHMTDKHCESGECVGLSEINSRIEEVVCKIGKLTAKYNELKKLGDWIRDNQNN